MQNEDILNQGKLACNLEVPTQVNILEIINYGSFYHFYQPLPESSVLNIFHNDVNFAAFICWNNKAL
jgi:hypothetical protein